MLQTNKVTRARARAHELQLRELMRAMAAFECDVLQVQGRPMRHPFGAARTVLVGEDLDSPALELTRSGWRSPLGQSRSGLPRMRWQLSGEQCSATTGRCWSGAGQPAVSAASTRPEP
ncbi:type II secretion system protein GspJ [Pseudomonas anguilliseptica]|uniref:type II secretion system protein GspJ n=1 Tax=Pseudomonas anguilliseptica TaxID=53406 RepID=UPI003736DB49